MPVVTERSESSVDGDELIARQTIVRRSHKTSDTDADSMVQTDHREYLQRLGKVRSKVSYSLLLSGSIPGVQAKGDDVGDDETDFGSFLKRHNAVAPASSNAVTIARVSSSQEIIYAEVVTVTDKLQNQTSAGSESDQRCFCPVNEERSEDEFERDTPEPDYSSMSSDNCGDHESPMADIRSTTDDELSEAQHTPNDIADDVQVEVSQKESDEHISILARQTGDGDDDEDDMPKLGLVWRGSVKRSRRSKKSNAGVELVDDHKLQENENAAAVQHKVNVIVVDGPAERSVDAVVYPAEVSSRAVNLSSATSTSTFRPKRAVRKRPQPKPPVHSLSLSLFSDKSANDILEITFQPEKNGLGFELISDGSTLVRNIYPDSAASRAGLKVGDVLVKVNGADISKKSFSDILDLLRAPAQNLSLSVVRDPMREQVNRSKTLYSQQTGRGVAAALTNSDRSVSQPRETAENEKLRKGTNMYLLQQMQAKAEEEVRVLLAECEKNPGDATRLQNLRHAQKLLENVMQQLSALRSDSPSRAPQSSTSSERRESGASTNSSVRLNRTDVRLRTVFNDLPSLRQSSSLTAAFLNFVILGGYDPAPLFFTMVAEDYAKSNTASVGELTRWAREIHATFLANQAPLELKVDQAITTSIKNTLLNSCDKEGVLKSLFAPVLHYCQDAVTSLLDHFRLQKMSDREFDGEVGDKYIVKMSAYFSQYVHERAARSRALASCIGGFLLQAGFVPAHAFVGLFDTCPMFNVKDKRAFWLKSRQTLSKDGHNMKALSWYDLASCDFCHEAIWTAFPHGFHCTGCGMFLHKYCIEKINNHCPTTGVWSRSRSKERPRLKLRNESETQLSKTARRLEIANSVFHVPLLDIQLPKDRGTGSGDELSATAKRSASSTPQYTAGGTLTPGLSLPSSETKLSPSTPTSAGSFATMRSKSRDDRDPDMDVEPELPSLDAVIPKEELRKIKSKERKRQEVINELFYTERVHVCKLKVMLKFFFYPLTSDALNMKTLVGLVFPNIEEVFNLHRHISVNFKTRRQEGAVVKTVGDLLLKHFSGERGERLQRACAKFCRDQSYALEYLRVQQRRDQKLANFLLEAASNPLCGRQELRDLLLCEMQRLTKYPLLIDSLLKYTQQETDEYKQLLEAAGLARDLLHFVNDEVRIQENRRKLRTISDRLDKRPIYGINNSILIEFMNTKLTDRHLLHDGELTWRINSTKHINVYVLLLGDIILLLHQQQDDRYSLRCPSSLLIAGREDSKRLHCPIIPLRDLLVRDNAADKCAFFLISALKVSESKEGADFYSQYDLVAKTKDSRKKWFGLINEAVEAYKKLPPLAVHHVKSNGSSAVSPTGSTDRTIDQCRNASSSMDSLDQLNSLTLTESEVRPEFIQPNEVICNVVMPCAESVIEQIQTPVSTGVGRRRLTSVLRSLSETRKQFAESFSISDDEISVFEPNPDESNETELIAESVKQVQMLQRLLSVESAVPNKSNAAPSLHVSKSLRSKVKRQLQYQENLLTSLNQAADRERDRLLSDLQDSQCQISQMLEQFSSSSSSQYSRAISYVSAVSPTDDGERTHNVDSSIL